MMVRTTRGTTRWTFLWLLGIAQITLGLTFIVPGDAPPGYEKTFRWIEWLDPWMMGALLIGCGLFALFTGVAKIKRLERFAFALLMFPFLALSVVYLAAYLVGAYEHGLIGVVRYGSLGVVVWAASGVMNLPVTHTQQLTLPPGGERDGP